MKTTPLEKWIAEKTGASNRLSRETLREYQLDKLRETLAYVKNNSRFYKRSLAGVDPGAVREMDDVARLPLTTPEEIASDPNGFSCVSPREIGRIVTLGTSGTTGRPKRVFFTEDDQALTVDFFHHGMTTLVDRRDTVLICMPGATEGSIGDLLKRGLDRSECRSIIYGPIRDEADALDTLLKEKVTCIVGIPSQIALLARLSKNATCRPAVRSVLISADYVPVSAVGAIESAWGATVYEHYGMTEMGFGGGVACDAREGYHLREADLLFEVVDPETGHQVQEGEYGEVVFSTLTRRGMPFIRYRTGDRARFLTGNCPCGTLLRRLDRVTGRLAEPARLVNGHTLSITQLDEALYKEPSLLTYAAELRTLNGCDTLHITVRSAGGPADLNALARGIEMELPHLFEDNRLKLKVKEGEVDYFTTGMLKRKILDSRKG